MAIAVVGSAASKAVYPRLIEKISVVCSGRWGESQIDCVRQWAERQGLPRGLPIEVHREPLNLVIPCPCEESLATYEIVSEPLEEDATDSDVAFEVYRTLCSGLYAYGRDANKFFTAMREGKFDTGLSIAPIPIQNLNQKLRYKKDEWDGDHQNLIAFRRAIQRIPRDTWKEIRKGMPNHGGDLLEVLAMRDPPKWQRTDEQLLGRTEGHIIGFWPELTYEGKPMSVRKIKRKIGLV